jgi:HK97 family phage prohead protease/HK97 family phage major capsid protein
MTIKNKVVHLNSQFTKDALPMAGDKIDNIFISGYASVNVPDRDGDIVPSSVWEKGMMNYLKNPVILAYHDHDEAIGRMTEHKIDSKGLWIKARISAASEEVFSKVKDGILTAFSVAFRVLDAEYNAATELFVIKELELMEISVVAVPCNQDTLFNLSKSFDSEEDYKNFKKQFAPKSESAKGLESSTEAGGITLKEMKMDPKDLEQMLANAAERAATAATKALTDKQDAEKATAKKAAEDEAAMQNMIAKALAAVTPSTTGAEKLLEEVTKRISDSETSSKKALDDLHAVIAEKTAELAAIQKSKMNFADGKSDDITYAEKETAVMLGKISRKGMEETKYGKALIEKFGARVPTGAISTPQSIWETEVSLNLENEVRRKLVVAPLLRNISMQTNVMKIPVNPEATGANWVTNANFGAVPGALGSAGPSAGPTTVTALSEITLSAYKVANNEYIAYEEEEDSLIVLLPIIRDAMVRRLARAVDKAYLLGAGSGGDPVKGLATYYTTSAGSLFPSLSTGVTTQVTVATLRAMRKALGALGLDPADVTFVVSTDCYFSLLEDAAFMTMDKVGPSATALTGQIGVVGNSSVLVSAEFPTSAAGTSTGSANIGAIAVNTSNFLAGNQRGLRFDTQDLVETQRKVLVASLRTGMTQLTTNLGQGVSTLRWNT